MKKWSLLLFMIFFNAYSQSLEFSQSKNTYLLFDKGCDKVKKNMEELYQKSISDFSCSCDVENKCSSEILLDKLPPRISYLLSKRDLKADGPNCYNSVMFLAGMVSGVYFSTEEIEVWLNSPLCENIDSKNLRQGDFISFQSYESNSGHIMMYLTPSLSFNKSMGSKSDPYEIVETSKYIESYNNGSSSKIARECINLPVAHALQSKKCRSKYTTIYRCKSIEDEFSFQIEKHKDIWEQYKKWGDCLNDYFLNGNGELYSQIKVMMKIMASYAKEKAKIPAFNELPTVLKEKIKDSYDGFPEQYYDILAARYYISAHSKNEGKKNEIERSFQNHFNKSYQDFSKKELLFLGNIYLGTSREKIGWSD